MRNTRNEYRPQVPKESTLGAGLSVVLIILFIGMFCLLMGLLER